MKLFSPWCWAFDGSLYFVNACLFFEKSFLNYLVDDFLSLFSVLSFLEHLLCGCWILYTSLFPLPNFPFFPLFPSLSSLPPFLLGDIVNFLFHTLLDGMSLTAGGRDSSTHSCFFPIQEPSRNGPGLLPQIRGARFLGSFYSTALSLKCCCLFPGPECSTTFHHKCLYSSSWGGWDGERMHTSYIIHHLCLQTLGHSYKGWKVWCLVLSHAPLKTYRFCFWRRKGEQIWSDI